MAIKFDENGKFIGFKCETPDCETCEFERELDNEMKHFSEGYREGSEQAVKAVMDLMYALREIGGQPTLKDLVKLAKRIRENSKK